MEENPQEFNEVHVVSVFLQYLDRLLLLKRSRKVGSYKGCWSAVSGYLEPGVTPVDQAMIEVQEETGLTQKAYHVKEEADPVKVEDREKNIRWVVHPFLFKLYERREIILDWENDDYRWILPEELHKYQTVPALFEVLQALQAHL